jgi:hypothetical protein
LIEAGLQGVRSPIRGNLEETEQLRKIEGQYFSFLMWFVSFKIKILATPSISE